MKSALKVVSLSPGPEDTVFAGSTVVFSIGVSGIEEQRGSENQFEVQVHYQVNEESEQVAAAELKRTEGNVGYFEAQINPLWPSDRVDYFATVACTDVSGEHVIRSVPTSFRIVDARSRRKNKSPSTATRERLLSVEPALKTERVATRNLSIDSDQIDDARISFRESSIVGESLSPGKSILDIGQPDFLLRPAVLHGRTMELPNLNDEQADFVTSKLNEHLRKEVLTVIGPLGEEMAQAVKTTVDRIDYREWSAAELSTVIREGVLSEIDKGGRSVEELEAVENRLANLASISVDGALHLNDSLHENPVFSSELRRAKTYKYARLANLDRITATKLAKKEIPLSEAGEMTLSGLVNEGLLNPVQKTDLQRVLDLGQLTSDNFALVSTLLSDGITSTFDLIGWEAPDWQRRIVKEELPLPPGETVETYAQNMASTIDHTYPSHSLLTRILGPKQTQRVDQLDMLEQFRTSEDRLIDDENPAKIDWTEAAGQRYEELDTALQDLTGFANTFRHLGVTDLINGKNASIDQKRSEILGRVQQLDTFYKNNPALDLRFVNFFDQREDRFNWGNIPKANQAPIKKQLMAYQRVLALCDETANCQLLLNKGYDSAIAVAAKTEAEFIATSGLSYRKARVTYAKAQDVALSAYVDSVSFFDMWMNPLKNSHVDNLSPQVINDLREIDGFADLFGPQNFCDCEHCRSILSPAAYFVDLMHFIEQHVSKPVFINQDLIDHPLYLKNRRPDLWKLQLTCENTNVLLPYLAVVNEVLETYLDNDVDGNIFIEMSCLSGGDQECSSNQKISFGLPFNLPLEEQRIYLAHFKITLHDIYRILRQPEAKVWRARLNLSEEELRTIVEPDPDEVKFRFGDPDSWEDFPVNDEQSKESELDRRGFIKFVGITRQELEELRNLRFNPDLAEIEIVKRPIEDELRNFPEILKNLTEERLDFIHRFIRLWRKTELSITEFDLILTAMKEANLITADFDERDGFPVLYLAQLLDVQEKLELTVDELCALVDERSEPNEYRSGLPVSTAFPKPPACQADRRLFERLFDLKKLFEEKDSRTHELNTSAVYHHYSLNTNPDDHSIDSKTPTLLGGLGISETELLLLFDLLKDEMPFDENGDTTLDRHRLSLLYRHTRLAKALRFSIEDFIQSLYINFGNNPVVTKLDQVHRLIRFREWLKSSPFTVPELRFILKGEESASVKYQTSLETVATLIQKLGELKSLPEISLEAARDVAKQISVLVQSDRTEAEKIITDYQDSGGWNIETYPGVGNERVILLANSLANRLASRLQLRFEELTGIVYAAYREVHDTLDFSREYHVPDNHPYLDNFLQRIGKASAVYSLKHVLAELFNSEMSRLEVILENKSDSSTALIFLSTDHSDENLVALNNLIRRTAVLLENISTLQEHLCTSFNLTANQLRNALMWIATDIHEVWAQIVRNTVMTGKESHVSNASIDPDLLISAMQQLERYLLLFRKFEYSGGSVEYLTKNHRALGISDTKNLTLDNLQALTFYKKLITLNDDAESSIHILLDSYLTDRSLNTTLMADLWRQDGSLLESLTHSLKLPTVPIEALRYLEETLQLCQTLGVNGYSLQKLVYDSSFAAVEAARDVILGAFESKYDDANTRQEKLQPYQDQISIRKRDALCDYIIAREKELKFKDTHDLYAFFLLDVEMDSCFHTSQVMAGISSLQLYIHRILVNLEQSDPHLNPDIVDITVAPSMIPAAEWEWRKNYRVWEANRKVFLYPENYTEPDLRDNKTPIFKELEEELLQEKITKESAEATYRKYFSQFAEVARLRIAGSYYHKEEKTYYFFGCTSQDPPQYYYRKWIRHKVWTPWEKIELGIDSREVSAIIHLGRLFLFWVTSQALERTTFRDGTSMPAGFQLKFDLNYAYQDENGKWIPAQKLHLDDVNTNNPLSADYNRIFSRVVNNKILLIWKEIKELDLFNNHLLHVNSVSAYIPTNSDYPCILDLNILDLATWPPSEERAWLGICSTTEPLNEWPLYHDNLRKAPYNERQVTSKFSPIGVALRIVGSSPSESVLVYGDQQFLMYIPRVPTFVPQISDGKSSYLTHIYVKRITQQLSTSLVNELGQILWTDGLYGFFSLSTQQRKEHRIGIDFINTSELLGPHDYRYYDNPDHIDFKGAYGTYYREMFFHIPFLIANHFNANQKFKEAKWWYERIFDPTASESSDDAEPGDRNWRYIEFRVMTIQKIKDMLTDDAAIEQYKNDPFNPHAIARLRPGAYQKTIVMKYIDNLLDWGDYLFAQDTMESINEARMLYVLAADILGKRPFKLGKCETAQDQNRTYARIGREMDKAHNSEFLITLENWHYNTARKAEIQNMQVTRSARDEPVRTMEPTAILRYPITGSHMDTASAHIHKDNASEVLQNFTATAMGRTLDFAAGVFEVKSTLVFCLPANSDLLKYWDRVEDRLFKIRHCMNISGIRRQLALFQPPIDPMLLVRARAAGLSLEDILAMLDAPLPPYRFSYVIEKAKQFAQTVQQFGNSLLSALDKKDVEELTLLRSVHERELLLLYEDIRKQQVTEAQYQYQATSEAKTNVQNRVNYYNNLLDTELIGSEITQQSSTRSSATYETLANLQKLLGGILSLLPQVGSPFAMKYGGVELSNNAQGIGLMLSSLGTIAQLEATSAGLEATFQRREQEWGQQLLLAEQELKQVEQQRLAAEIRQFIAEKELENHERNMEQADELYEFYKGKFTNLGLYNYLSTTLNRLYREAYNVAHEVAKMAERTYQFERDDDTIFIAGDNWQYDRAGLLAGERLLLQLQRLEKAYIEQHTRDYEMTQFFSLALFNPEALLNLKETGACEFSIPEILFDLSYPGQYKRIVKSVRLSIPCVVGPYTNISAKLSLLSSHVRKEARLDESALLAIPNSKLNTTSIATSTGQNDSGLFELNFRDERYLPFEGAGAISNWGLELPSKLRMFDYDSIADVIIHVSYTARDDGGFRGKVEDDLSEKLRSLAEDQGLFRLFSLKHEFPTAFHGLVDDKSTNSTANVELTIRHFPYFLAQKGLKLDEMGIYLKFKHEELVNYGNLTLNISKEPDAPQDQNSNGAKQWKRLDGTNLHKMDFDLSGDPIGNWTITMTNGGLIRDKLDDILLLLKYKLASQ